MTVDRRPGHDSSSMGSDEPGVPRSAGMKRDHCLSKIKASAIRLGIGPLAIAYVSVAGGQITLDRHGLTGSWYDPANSGEGIELEVYPNGLWCRAAGSCSQPRRRGYGGLVTSRAHAARLPLTRIRSWT